METRLFAQLREAFDEFPVLVSYIDENLRYVFNNRACHAWFGAKAEDLAGRTMPEVMGTAAFERLRPYAEGALGGETQHFEAEIPHRAGGTRSIDAFFLPGRNEDGKSAGFFAFVFDVSERKRSEREHAQLAEQYRLFIEHAPAAIAVLDRDIRYLAASARWRADFGLPADIIGLSHYDLFPELPSDWKAVHRRGLAGEVLQKEEDRFVRRDGSVQWLRWEVRPWKTPAGEVGGLIFFSEDITRRKAAEEQFKSVLGSLEAMFDNISQLAWMARADGHIYWYNRRWYEYTGTTPAEMEGWGWQSVHDPKMLPSVLERWRAAIATGTAFDMEFPLKGADGRFRWFLTRIVPFKDRDGKVVRWFGTNTDIQAKVEQAETKSRELRRYADELESFSYSAAHDLRAPLRQAASFAQLADRAIASGDAAKAQGFLREVTGAAANMSLIIDGLLSLGRLTTGEIHRETLDLTALASEAAAEAARSDPGTAVRLSIQPGLQAAGDPKLIKILLVNLFTNAFKFSSKQDQPQVSLTRTSDGVFCVRDNGAGFEMDKARRMFEPFQRLHSPRDYQGTGLGLAICRRIVQRHDGEIWAEGAPGQGAAFFFRLPKKHG